MLYNFIRDKKDQEIDKIIYISCINFYKFYINYKKEYNKELTENIENLSNEFINFLHSKKELLLKDIIIGNNNIIYKNKKISFKDHLIKKDLETKFKYILSKEKKDNIKNQNINQDILLGKKEIKYDYKKDIKLLEQKLKKINDNLIYNFINYVLDKKENHLYKNIIFYDLETMIGSNDILVGCYYVVDLKEKNSFKLILSYTDKPEYKYFISLLKEIVKELSENLKKIGVKIYLLNNNKITETLIKREKNKSLLSGFNITGFDNKILLKNYVTNEEINKKEEENKLNNRSLDIYEFISLEGDKGEFNLILKNNGIGLKIMNHEELLKMLNKNYIQNVDNKNNLSKLIIYNIYDTILSYELFHSLISSSKEGKDINLATKRVNSSNFINYINQKI